MHRVGITQSKASCYMMCFVVARMCFVVAAQARGFPSTSKLRDLFPSWLPRFLYSFREWRYEIKAYFVIITAMFTEFWLSFSKGKFSQENHWTDSSVASCLQSTHIQYTQCSCAAREAPTPAPRTAGVRRLRRRCSSILELRCSVCEFSWAELESKRFDTLKLLSVGLHHYCRDFNIVSWIDLRNLSLELVKVLLMSTFLNDCLIFLWKFYFEKWLSKFMVRNNHNLGSIMLQFLYQINAWKLSYWTRIFFFFF